MNQYIVSYDLQSTTPDPHHEFLLQAVSRNWSQWLPMQGGRRNKLPNTTLVGMFPSMEAAEGSFFGVIAATQKIKGAAVNVKKLVIIQVAATRSYSDEQD